MPNIKPFLILYNWTGKEYPTAINKYNFTLFKRNNPGIALIVFHINVNLVITKSGKGQHVITHKSVKQLDVSNHYYERAKRLFCY